MKKTSGVYIIKNLQTNRCYVGSSKNVEQRLTKHKAMLIDGVHHSVKLQEDFEKYGMDAFVFELIQECPEAEARMQERRYIELFNTERGGYNSVPDKTNYHQRIARVEEKIEKLLDGKGEKGKVYTFDFFDACNKMGIKPSILLRMCDIDGRNEIAGYRQLERWIIGCDVFFERLCFNVSTEDTHGTDEIEFVEMF